MGINEQSSEAKVETKTTTAPAKLEFVFGGHAWEKFLMFFYKFFGRVDSIPCTILFDLYFVLTKAWYFDISETKIY